VTGAGWQATTRPRKTADVTGNSSPCRTRCSARRDYRRAASGWSGSARAALALRPACQPLALPSSSRLPSLQRPTRSSATRSGASPWSLVKGYRCCHRPALHCRSCDSEYLRLGGRTAVPKLGPAAREYRDFRAQLAPRATAHAAEGAPGRRQHTNIYSNALAGGQFLEPATPEAAT
jgi:hypothetical protein